MSNAKMCKHVHASGLVCDLSSGHSSEPFGLHEANAPDGKRYGWTDEGIGLFPRDGSSVGFGASVGWSRGQWTRSKQEAHESNLVGLVNAHLDGSARPADTKALVDILDRALRSNDNGCARAREALRVYRSGSVPPWEIRTDGAVWDAAGRDIGETDWTIGDEQKAVDSVNMLGSLAEHHIITVARLEAERDAAIAARNDLERRNQELTTQLDSVHDQLSQIGATLDVQAAEAVTATVVAREYTESIETELSDERRRHAETAAALAQAEKRIEELSAELTVERVAKVAAREEARRAVERAVKVFL